MAARIISRYVFGLFGIATFLYCCVSCSKQSSVTPIPYASQTSSSVSQGTQISIQESPTASLEEVSTCIWPPKQVFSANVDSIAWSEDGKNVQFSIENQKDGYFFDIEENELKDLPNPQIADHDQRTTQNADAIGQEFNITDYSRIFLSPDENSAVFLKEKETGNLLYLQNKNNPTAFLLGTVNGVIDQGYWINHGKELLLSIDWLSPSGIKDAYVYRVDLLNKSMDVEIPNKSEYENLTLLGISPDERWALYVKYSGKDRSVYLHDLSSKKEIKTSLPFPPLDYQWLTEDEFIAVGYLEEALPPYFYRYDISRDEVRIMIDRTLDIHMGIKDAALISPTHNRLAFIHSGDQALYLLECN